MARFESSLNFSSANEDGLSELAALKLNPDKRVLCLTASGARPLDLLLGNPAEIVSIDSNPFQNELLRLKIAAISALNDADLYAYLGLAPCKDRQFLHEKVVAYLPQASQAFWQSHRKMILSGVWHAGRWERVLRVSACLTNLLRGRAVRRLLSAETVAEQAEIWDAELDNRFWRLTVRALARPWFWTHVIGEPGGAYLPSRHESEKRFAGVFRRGAHNILFRDSDFAILLFKGRHTPQGALPLHMCPENLSVIRDRLDRIRIEHADLANLTEQVYGRFDAFSLSDFGSYCEQNNYDACWKSVLHIARPGARYCERVFMNPINPGLAIAPHLNPEPELSNDLTQSDRAFIYDIRCGIINAGVRRVSYN